MGQNGKMSVAKREMWSEWESVCVAKDRWVRMGKCLYYQKRCGQNGKIGCEEKGMQYKDKCVCGRKRVWDGVGDVQEHRFCVRIWV